MNGRLRVLVCGTNYGRFYLEAIRIHEEAYTLTGILARGSQRSRELAAAAGVPLLQSVDDVFDCDMACFAIGSSGSNIIPHLLRRGIHVLCEHPRHKDDLVNALQSAVENRVCFHMNGHFGDLPAPGIFISRVRECGPPLYLSLTVTDRSLYGALDILGRGLGKLGPYEFGSPARAGAFACITGVLGGAPATLQIQDGSANSEGLTDGSREYLIDFRIVAVYPAGTLSLLSLAGPVVWNRNYNRTAGNETLWTGIDEVRPLNGQELKRERIVANLGAIDRLAQHMKGDSAAR